MKYLYLVWRTDKMTYNISTKGHLWCEREKDCKTCALRTNKLKGNMLVRPLFSSPQTKVDQQRLGKLLGELK